MQVWLIMQLSDLLIDMYQKLQREKEQLLEDIQRINTDYIAAKEVYIYTLIEFFNLVLFL